MLPVAAYKRACAAFDEWWRRTQRDFWRSLSGRRFEIELAALFNRLGWQARPTPASNDGGIDVELFRDGTRTIVQCQAHAKPVGPAVVRELFGALAASEAQSAMVASLSGFSPGARAFAVEHGVELIDLEWILSRQRALEVPMS
jgi:restriction system protein